jgi:hypothetical protein
MRAAGWDPLRQLAQLPVAASGVIELLNDLTASHRDFGRAAAREVFSNGLRRIG